MTPKASDSCAAGNDDSCDGEANKGCDCVNGAERACVGVQGNCAKGKQVCVAGSCTRRPLGSPTTGPSGPIGEENSGSPVPSLS